MAGTINEKLRMLGITLPDVSSPIANYVPAVRTGNLLFISGQVAMDGTSIKIGRLGEDLEIEGAQAFARLCGLSILAQAREALEGDLDRVVQIVKLVGFVNSTPGFVSQPWVINGASDLMVEVFGERGRHARSTLGCSSLPGSAPVEVEAIIEVE